MGTILGALPVVGGIIKSVFGDKAAREAADAAYDTAASSQFAAEFQARANRTWWDSFIDGVNRVPRPCFALAIIYVVFIWPARDMAGFVAYAQAISVVPEGFWYIAIGVVGFFFGGRMQMEGRSFRMTERQIQQAKAISQQQEEKAASPPSTERMNDSAFSAAMASPAPLSNAAIDEWNRRRREGR